MIRKLNLLVLILLFFHGGSIKQAVSQEIPLFEDSVWQEKVFVYSESANDLSLPEKSPEVLGTKEFLRDSAIYYSAIWALRLFYVRNKNDRIFDTSFSKWIDNITDFPEWDDGDDFVTNFIIHPFAGYMSYIYYREMGHGFWASAFGSFLQSTLFEYTVEGLVETPSLVDLIFTPGLGVPVGYVAEKTSGWLMKKDNIFAQVAGRIINPMQNVVRDRKIVLFNPLTGKFEYMTSFSIDHPPAKKKALDLGYPTFFESALPRGYFSALIEVADLDDGFNGQFIFYHIKAEFPSKYNLYSLYLRISQSGVNNVEGFSEEIDDGFEFSNMVLGAKGVGFKGKSWISTVGVETVLPTAFKDNLDRLKTIVTHRRDFPIYLKGAMTFSPYITAAVWKGWFSAQSNAAMDIILWADKLEDDDFEARFRYSAAVGIDIPVEYSVLLFAEFNGYTVITADTFDKTDLFILSGIKFGNRVSPKVALQLPLSGPTSDMSQASFIFEVSVRF